MLTPEVRKLLQDFVAFTDQAVDGAEGLMDIPAFSERVPCEVEDFYAELHHVATDLQIRAQAAGIRIDDIEPDPKGGLRVVQ